MSVQRLPMIEYKNDHYRSEKNKPFFLASFVPSLVFYYQLFLIVFKASRAAQKGSYDYENWKESSFNVLKKLEAIGVVVDINGVDNIRRVEGPVVFIGNHMSMMETLLLPIIIQPLKNVTFVVKEALLNYPIFKHVMRSRNPIAVTRTNPRQDLKTVMGDGVERLNDNISVIVFPQTTRANIFDPKQMSSIGVKLAKKAGASIIPLALKTDGWENGKMFKDFGRINTDVVAYFSFGEAIQVEGKGVEEQERINEFITGELQKWGATDS